MKSLRTRLLCWGLPVLACFVVAQVGGTTGADPGPAARADESAAEPARQSMVIRGRVFYDLDEDGSFNPQSGGDLPLAGWKVRITGPRGREDAFTDAEGYVQFLRPIDGTVYVLESLAPAPGFVGIAGGQWLPTSATTALVVADSTRIRIGFGNVFLTNTPEFARSKGYWHNQGQGELAACDPLWREALNDLCLRTNVTNPNGEAGTLFSVPTDVPFQTAFAQLSAYLVTPAQGVLANILSVQYAAANLNWSCGPLAGRTTYIDRLGDGVLISFEDLAALTLDLLCDPRSANTGPGGDEEWRAMIRMCLDEWEDMNSTGGSIFTRSTSPPAFPTPY